jgi:hypothetical protein
LSSSYLPPGDFDSAEQLAARKEMLQKRCGSV